jgi:integrase
MARRGCALPRAHDPQLLHLRGVPWARIGEQLGHRNLAVTANTYTHVLTDETELDYEALPGTKMTASNAGRV